LEATTNKTVLAYNSWEIIRNPSDPARRAATEKKIKQNDLQKVPPSPARAQFLQAIKHAGKPLFLLSSSYILFPTWLSFFYLLLFYFPHGSPPSDDDNNEGPRHRRLLHSPLSQW